MLNWFKKDPLKDLNRQYERLLIEARDLQRNGDIIGYAEKSAKAEGVLQEIDRLQAASSE